MVRQLASEQSQPVAQHINSTRLCFSLRGVAHTGTHRAGMRTRMRAVFTSTPMKFTGNITYCGGFIKVLFCIGLGGLCISNTKTLFLREQAVHRDLG